MIVASDGSTDATAERAREAGADLVLELPPRRQGRGAERRPPSALPARSSPSPTPTAPGRRTRCAACSPPSPTRGVGYVCGQVRFTDPDGDNLEGAYWRYEMAVREMESELAGVTAGNGAIYAVRRDAYIPLAALRQPRPLASPSRCAKRGLRSLYAPAAPGRGEDGADDRGRVRPQTADDGRPLGHRRRRRDAAPARLLAALRLRALLAPAAALRDARSCTSSSSSPTSRCSAAGWFYVLDPRSSSWRCSARARGARRRLPLTPLRVARYYVLTHGLDRRSASGTACATAPGGRWEKAEGTR